MKCYNIQNIESNEKSISALKEANKTIAAQAEQIAVLNQTVAVLTEKTDDLNAEIANLKKSSRNSNTPPSSDGYGKPKAVKNQRTRSGLKLGGQPGREGVTRTHEAPSERIVELKPIETNCDECGGTVRVEEIQQS